MIQKQLKTDDLDRMIHNALASNNNLLVPTDLSERTIRKIEKRILLRELILELFFKAGIITGSLTILGIVFIWINDNAVLTRLYTQLLNNWQLSFSLLLLIIITILIDQVVLKFYTALNLQG